MFPNLGGAGVITGLTSNGPDAKMTGARGASDCVIYFKYASDL